jgi:hypothetical protein
MVAAQFSRSRARVASRATSFAYVRELSADLSHSISRQAIKKYIQANNNLGGTTDAMFSSHLSRAIAAGEKSGDFSRPKGQSSPALLSIPFVYLSAIPILQSDNIIFIVMFPTQHLCISLYHSQRVTNFQVQVLLAQ